MRERQLPTTVRLSEKDARDVLLAELLETPTEVVPGEKPVWTPADAAAATRDARHLAGERRTPGLFLPLRARLVLARLKERRVKTTLEQTGFATTPVLLTLATLGYLAGVLTDRLATTGSVVNLLSPPLLAFFLWNLFVYLLLLVQGASALTGKTVGAPLRSALVRLFEKLHLPGLKKDGLRTRFWARWAPLMTPKLALCAAQALHLATLAFAIGLLTSLAVRGIGTAYVVGWESTWLADRPDIVLGILNATYGLVPGSLPMPDVEHVRLMNLAEGLSAPLTESTSWLLRLMGLISALVLVPRACLALIATVRIRRREKALPFPVTSPYYRRLLLSDDEARRREVVVLVPESNGKDWEDVCRRTEALLKARDVALKIVPAELWDTTPEAILESVRKEGASERLFWVALDASATPEEEIHGRFLTALSENVVVLLNVSSLFARFGKDAPNVRSRLALWETFAHDHGARSTILDLAETSPEFIDALKALVDSSADVFQSNGQP